MTAQVAQQILEDFFGRMISVLEESWGTEFLGTIHFGSSARSKLKRDTDIDLLVVRVSEPQDSAELRLLEKDIEDVFAPTGESLEELGYHIEISPLIRGEERFRCFSKLYLDMSVEGRILFDRVGLLEAVLERTRTWIQESGAVRIQKGLKWYWRLNPGYKPGDRFEVGWGKLESHRS